MSKKTPYFTLLLILAFSSCGPRIRSTFSEEYTTKVKIAPNQSPFFSTDGNALFISGISQFQINGPKIDITKVNLKDGQTQWKSGVHKLANVSKMPRNMVFIEDQNIALIFDITQASLVNQYRPTFKISAIDLMQKRELWNITKQGSGFSTGGYYFPENKSYMIQTPTGLESIDVLTGKVLWQINNVTSRFNFGSALLRLSKGAASNITYLEEMDRVLLRIDNKISLLNQYNGELEWQIEDQIGNIAEADILEDQRYAVFYGRKLTDNNTGASQAQRVGSSGIGRAASRVGDGLSRGAQESPIILVDLETGRILWRSSFFMNGQYKINIAYNKLLVSGIIAYAFDLQTGEATWQNVPNERLGREGIRGVFSEFTGIDYTSDRMANRVKDPIIIDNSIFVVFPEIFEQGGNRNHVSIRLYNFLTGEMVWKTEGSRMEIRDMYFKSGILFLIANGQFARASKLIAIDPYTGKVMYEIDARMPLSAKTVITEEIIYSVTMSNDLNLYNIRNGQLIQRERLGRSVSDIFDMGDKLMVVYRTSNLNNNRSSIIAFHDRNSFNLINQMAVPFFSTDMVSINDQLFMTTEEPYFKAIAHMDLNKMELYGYATITANGSKKTNGVETILDPYHFILSKDGKNIYLAKKKKFVKYQLSSSPLSN
jgi:outer membrane protein assembly factor BamB